MAASGPLLAATRRLLESLRDPVDRQVVGPAAVEEIIYRVLRGEQGRVCSMPSPGITCPTPASRGPWLDRSGAGSPRPGDRTARGAVPREVILLKGREARDPARDGA